MNLVAKDKFGRWSPSTIDDINGRLEKLFRVVRQHPDCPYREVRCFPYHILAQVEPGEVVVYFTTRHSSLVLKNGGSSTGRSGSSWLSRDGVISEIYVETFLSNGDYLQQAANTAFHEALHNKVDAESNVDIVH